MSLHWAISSLTTEAKYASVKDSEHLHFIVSCWPSMGRWSDDQGIQIVTQWQSTHCICGPKSRLIVSLQRKDNWTMVMVVVLCHTRFMGYFWPVSDTESRIKILVCLNNCGIEHKIQTNERPSSSYAVTNENGSSSISSTTTTTFAIIIIMSITTITTTITALLASASHRHHHTLHISHKSHSFHSWKSVCAYLFLWHGRYLH